MRWLALIFVVGLIWAQGQSREIPEYEGDSNPQHNGQPKFCQAKDINGYKKNCGICDSDCSSHHGSQCKTYCRMNACFCHPACSTMNHVERKSADAE